MTQSGSSKPSAAAPRIRGWRAVFTDALLHPLVGDVSYCRLPVRLKTSGHSFLPVDPPL